MTEREVWQVAAYVRSLGRQPSEPITGDAARGETVFRGKGGCIQCHTVTGDGGRMGPALAGVGLRRGPAYLRQTILDPESRVPATFSFIELTTREGRKLTGIGMNEDTTSIQIRDLSDTLHSFWKDELAEIRRLRGKTPMPGLKSTLSGAEVNDLVAYLASLREKP